MHGALQVWSLIADPAIPRALTAQALHLRFELAAAMPNFAQIAEDFAAGTPVDTDAGTLKEAVMTLCMGEPVSADLSDGAPSCRLCS